MPRNQSIPICGGNLMECYQKAEIELSEDYSQELSCKCLPSCTTISYDIETSQTKYYKYPNYLVKEKDFLNKTIFSPIDVSSLHISFKEKDFIALRRSELYGFSDFFANIGGLFGLFLGIIDLLLWCPSPLGSTIAFFVAFSMRFNRLRGACFSSRFIYHLHMIRHLKALFQSS
uniref:Uncharacterized protein n=1 Tax=Megaselia scalaris TaxID=36166 RepID=T1GE13_MEGSC